MFCAYLTGVGFLCRGILALIEHPILQHRVTRVFPHVVDTLLLASALGMVFSWSISVQYNSWIVAKLLALLVYIGFGLLMLRFGNTHRKRIIGLLGGLLSYAYIIGAAHSKSIWLGLA
ncbi:MAG: SirB2 family protein [Arenicella sp.]|nr:SirB2 family protein [Arenicella sp.]